MIRSWRKAALGLASGALLPPLASCSSVFPTPATAMAVGAEPVVRQEMARPRSVTPERKQQADDGVEIWLVSNNYHTSLIVPLDWLEDGGLQAPEQVDGARWVNLSWGDRIAYEQERWLRPTEVLRALFTPTDSVMELIRVDYDPRWVFPDQELYLARIPRGAGPALAAFIDYNRQPPTGGPGWTVTGDSTWGEGCLVASPHSYGFPRLCNSWTAGALESCGYSFGPPGRLFASALTRSARRQGFERVSPLTDDERQFLAEYLREIGHVAE